MKRITIIFLIFLIAFINPLISKGALQGVTLINPGFNNTAVGWTFSGNSSNAYFDTSSKTEGSHSCSITTTSSSPVEVSQQLLTGVQASQEGTFTIDISTLETKATVQIFLEWYDSDDGLITNPGRVTGTSASSGTPTFTTLTVTSDAPSNTAKVTVGITATTSFSSEIVYIDNAQVSGAALPEWEFNAIFVFPFIIAIIFINIIHNRYKTDN
ncbi:MAG: hypothetical protein ACXAC7_07530 [Candidatus Hodarchaeales archaeon]